MTDQLELFPDPASAPEIDTAHWAKNVARAGRKDEIVRRPSAAAIDQGWASEADLVEQSEEVDNTDAATGSTEEPESVGQTMSPETRVMLDAARARLRERNS